MGQKIGVVLVKSMQGENDFTMRIFLPEHGATRVEKYFLWSMEATDPNRRGVGYSDALAKRVGKDNFRVLWTRQEMADLYVSCYPQLSPLQKLWKRQILHGRYLPHELRINTAVAERENNP